MAVRLDDGEDSLAEMHEINVTPFINVMLVLLIIFMVAAPLATVDISVNLPTSTAEPQPRPPTPQFLTVKADLTLALGDDMVERAALGAALDGATGGDRDTRIFLRADKSVPYGNVMEVMNLLRGAGYLKVGTGGIGAVIALTADDRKDVRRWLICGMLVLCVHAVIVAALIQLREPIKEGDFGNDVILLELRSEQVQTDPTSRLRRSSRAKRSPIHCRNNNPRSCSNRKRLCRRCSRFRARRFRRRPRQRPRNPRAPAQR
jgi:biopolymer transport protein ExbD